MMSLCSLSPSRLTALLSGNIGRVLGALLLVAVPLLAQNGQRVTTGSAAASAFVHQRNPIHPLCVWFPQERASRGTPIAFATCSDASIAPELRDGWWTAQLPEQRGYSSYRVLAREGDRFLLALESSGGGTGEFSDLSWVRVGPTTISDVKDILGGDRCAGGLSGYHVDARTVAFSRALSTADIIRLGGVSVADTVLDRLRSGYQVCNGYASYTYDIATDSLMLTSVTLAAGGSTAVRSDTAPLRRDPRACFDDLARRAAAARQATMRLPELRTFVARFDTECIR